jgi:hypothetical protein
MSDALRDEQQRGAVRNTSFATLSDYGIPHPCDHAGGS